MTDFGRFEEKEIVWAKYKHTYYKGRLLACAERATKARGPAGGRCIHYRISWIGWSKQHESWVPDLPGRLYAVTPENDKLVASQQPSNTNKRKRSSKKSSGVAQRAPLPDPFWPDEKERVVKRVFVKAKHAIQLAIPPALIKVLLNDQKQVKEREMLLTMPREQSVEYILNAFIEATSSKLDRIEKSCQLKTVQMLLSVFDQVLDVVLLYRFEKLQYASVMKKRDGPSTVYGAEHLLRFIVKAPELLSFTDTHPAVLQKYQVELDRLLLFLYENKQWFGQKNYFAATASYVRKYKAVTH